MKTTDNNQMAKLFFKRGVLHNAKSQPEYSIVLLTKLFLTFWTFFIYLIFHITSAEVITNNNVKNRLWINKCHPVFSSGSNLRILLQDTLGILAILSRWNFNCTKLIYKFSQNLHKFENEVCAIKIIWLESPKCPAIKFLS